MTGDEPGATLRDARLFGPGPKRILTLDGGGVRGVVSLAFLARLEAEIDAIEGRPTALGDWFDLIGGASTGAIIATALALGLRVAEVKALYDRLAPAIFRKRGLRIAGWQAKFDARPLNAEIEAILGTRRLDSADLRTGLCIVAKRMDTGSAWVLANNPRAPYWETPADAAFLGNRHLRLANLVRASTAAPTYFDPELIEIAPGQPPGLFVDGGLTPHNNPALIMLLMAILPAYGLNWTPSPDQLMVVSVGAGGFRPTMSAAEANEASALTLGLRALSAMIAEGQALTLALMSLLGETALSWSVNSEVGDLGAVTPPGGKWLKFVRYDVRIERDWLAQELGRDLDAATLARLRRMDAPANMPMLYEMACAAAKAQVSGRHLRFGGQATASPPAVRS